MGCEKRTGDGADSARDPFDQQYKSLPDNEVFFAGMVTVAGGGDETPHWKRPLCKHRILPIRREGYAAQDCA